MFKINKRISVKSSSVFSVREVVLNSQTNNVKGNFTCCSCGFVNDFVIVPFVSGYPVGQLYQANTVLTEEELLEKSMVTRTSTFLSHLGGVTVDDLPTLYFGTTCSSCANKFICLFGCGEKQPGMNILKISGFWCYSEL